MRIAHNCWRLEPLDYLTLKVGLWGEFLREIQKDLCAEAVFEHIIDGGAKVEVMRRYVGEDRDVTKKGARRARALATPG